MRDTTSKFCFCSRQILKIYLMMFPRISYFMKIYSVLSQALCEEPSRHILLIPISYLVAS